MTNNTANRTVGKRTIRFRIADERSLTLTDVRHVRDLSSAALQLMEDSLRVSKENKEMLRERKTKGLYRLEGNVQTRGATIRHRSGGISNKNG